MQINRRRLCLFMAAWPQIAAALQAARITAKALPAEWRSLDAESARELNVLASLIIPSDDGPGAREAGVIHFIDQSLATFAADDLPRFQSGLAEVQRKREALFAGSVSIAGLAEPQQMELMRAIEHTEFFDLLRTYTVFGYLGNPSYGGNRERIGWEQIGFEHQMAYSHPFGYYDAENK